MDENVIEDISNIVFQNLKQENQTLVLLRRQLVEVQTSIKNLMTAIEQGIITQTRKQRLIELEETQNDLELKIVKEELRRPPITNKCPLQKPINNIDLLFKNEQEVYNCFIAD